MKKVILSLVIGGLSVSGNCFANPLEAVKDKCDIAYHKVQDGARKVKNSAYEILKKPATKKVLAIGAVAGTGAAAYIFAPNIVKKGAKVVADKGLDALNSVKEYFGYAQKVQPVVMPEVVPEVVSWNPLHKVNGILEQIKNGVYSVLGICAGIGAGYGGYKIYQKVKPDNVIEKIIDLEKVDEVLVISSENVNNNGGTHTIKLTPFDPNKLPSQEELDQYYRDVLKVDYETNSEASVINESDPNATNNGVNPVINEGDPNATNNGEKPQGVASNEGQVMKKLVEQIVKKAGEKAEHAQIVKKIVEKGIVSNETNEDLQRMLDDLHKYNNEIRYALMCNNNVEKPENNN